jgi:hypothetical protein
MEDDVAAGRPMLAALCVSKMRPSILVCGFFLAAQVLGAFLAIRRARRCVCLPRDRAAACAFILWKPASASGARCFVKKAIEIRGIEQVQQETMSFFERLKTGRPPSGAPTPSTCPYLTDINHDEDHCEEFGAHQHEQAGCVDQRQNEKEHRVHGIARRNHHHRRMQTHTPANR